MWTSCVKRNRTKIIEWNFRSNSLSHTHSQSISHILGPFHSHSIFIIVSSVIHSWCAISIMLLLNAFWYIYIRYMRTCMHWKMMIELLLNLNACNTTLALLQSTRNSHEHRQQLVHKQRIKQWNTLKDCRVVCPSSVGSVFNRLHFILSCCVFWRISIEFKRNF